MYYEKVKLTPYLLMNANDKDVSSYIATFKVQSF